MPSLRPFFADTAELLSNEIAKGKRVGFEGKQGNYDLSEERITMKGNVTLRISSPGVSPVVVNADEIEAVPDRE